MSLYIRKLIFPQLFQNLFAGVFLLKLLLKYAIDQQCQETDQEMSLYPVVTPQIYRTRREIGLHDPKAGFYLPSAFAHLQDVPHRVIKKVGTYSIKAIIPCLLSCLGFIKVVENICYFPFFCE